MTRKVTSGSIASPALDVHDLYCDTVGSEPVNVDWSGYDDESETHSELNWSVIQPYEEDDFKEDTDWNERHLGESSYEGMEESNQPMMDYYYPLPDGDTFDKSDAQAINNLPLCIVYFEDEEKYALALTGGGMDLSWEICEAYIRLGYLPPLHFSDLPDMAGRGVSARDRAIIRACMRSAAVSTQWAVNIKNHLKDMTKRGKEARRKMKEAVVL